MSWQIEYINSLFGWVDAEGRRRFKRSALWIGKKQGKSTLSSILATYLMFESPASETYILSPVVKQAKICFDEARYICETHPALNRRTKSNILDKRLSDKKGGGKVEVLAATKQLNTAGFNASTVIWDEFAAFSNDVAIDAWDQLLYASMARPAPLSLVLSTAQHNSKHTLAYEEYQRAVRVLKGEDEDINYLPIVHGIEEGDDWHDETVWRKCCPSVGHACQIETLRDMHDRAVKNPREEYVFKTLILNSWNESSPDRWIAAADWEACSGGSDVDELKRLCKAGEASAIVGVDLAKSRDLSATVVLVKHEDIYHLCSPRFYVPTKLTEQSLREHKQDYRTHARRGNCELMPGRVTDYPYMAAAIREECEAWSTEKVSLDPWGSTALVNDLEEEGYECVLVQQTWPVLGPAGSELERLILSGRIRHPNHPLLNWCVGNCVPEQSKANYGVRPVKESKSSGAKIDVVIAALMALSLHMAETDSTPYILFD